MCQISKDSQLNTYNIKQNPKYSAFFEMNTNKGNEAIEQEEKQLLKEQEKERAKDPEQAVKLNRVAP
jgi:hypothetical protein